MEDDEGPATMAEENEGTPQPLWVPVTAREGDLAVRSMAALSALLTSQYDLDAVDRSLAEIGVEAMDLTMAALAIKDRANATDRVGGRKVAVGHYGHPQWLDGAPVLVGQEVETPDGWRGIVSSVSCEEVSVSAISDGMDDWYEEFGPDVLTRLPARPAVVRG